jgi:cell division inhibitor SulA
MSALDPLLQNANLWRGGESTLGQAAIASGFAPLDEKLGGWPVGALIELIAQREGIGELSILLPALAHLAGQERWIALVNPPYIPYAPAFAAAGIDLGQIVVVQARGTLDTLWSMEQALRSGACSAVLGWPGFLTEQAIRRLQLAAETGRTLGVWFTACAGLPRTSPVPYRLRIDWQAGRTRIEILKRRGGGVPNPLLLANVVAMPEFPSPADRDLSARGRAA